MAQTAPAPPEVDPKATDLLKKMSDFLAGQTTFSVRTESTTEVLLTDGEKIDVDTSSRALVKRPNMLRSDRTGDRPASLYYDGTTMTLYGKTENMYATAEAPPTIDGAIDFARDRLGIDAPAADLLYSRPYTVMTEDMVGASYLGKTMVHGIPCHHLSFRGNETDWQIWIRDGDQPLPMKLVIVSKKMQAAPEFRVELSQWDFSPTTGPDAFRFTPPEGATRIQFESLMAGAAR